MPYITPIQLYAAATSTGGDSLAYVMIPKAGRIVAVTLGIYCASTGATPIRAEISLQSTNQLTTNDARNVIFSTVRDQNDATMSIPGPQIQTDIPVTEMDRVFLHATFGTSTAWRLVGQILLRT